jgi:hypothetical protein
MLQEGHQGINGLPQGRKSYPIHFSRFLYYEHLKIIHLFDTKHIGKNVTKTLWQILGRRSDKGKIVKICSDIKESNHAIRSVIHINSDGYQNISTIS